MEAVATLAEREDVVFERRETDDTVFDFSAGWLVSTF